MDVFPITASTTNSSTVCKAVKRCFQYKFFLDIQQRGGLRRKVGVCVMVPKEEERRGGGGGGRKTREKGGIKKRGRSVEGSDQGITLCFKQEMINGAIQQLLSHRTPCRVHNSTSASRGTAKSSSSLGHTELK
jgi:hypothetical protein